MLVLLCEMQNRPKALQNQGFRAILSNTSTVMATIGMAEASSLGRRQIARVASYPFLTGIWMSMRMAR